METLQYKEPHKQIRCAEETLNIFVPLAYFIGAFRLKCDLEDMCLSYLEPETYQSLKVKQEEILKDYEKCLKEAEKDVCNLLHQHHIKHTIRAKIMNVYQIYKKINKGYRINDIHDLVNIKIMVNKKEDCYKALGLIHELYTPLNQKFKDYIACPKTNMYRSVHTTVFGPDNHLIQFQIKTHQMDQINTIGLAAYWEEFKEEASGKMQHDLKMNYQFFTSLQDINSYIQSDSEYIAKVKEEIFTNNIYVYSLSGEIIELPYGSTVIDFAYKLHTELGNHLYKAFINGKEVKLTTQLNNKDRILILQNEKAHPLKRWLEHVETLNAKRRIRDYFKSKE
jgi:GTP pyrophosphokinase